MTVYHLYSEHEWADFDDIHPEVPRIPKDLLLPRITTPVDDVADLYVCGDPPHFSHGGEAVDVGDEQLAHWRSMDLDHTKAQERCRRRIADAASSYEDAVAAAIAEFRPAVDRYRSTVAEMEANSAELAAVLMRHKNAAEEYEQQRAAKKQAELDALYGERRIVLYGPNRINSNNKADWIARVHLVTCTRKPFGNPEALRARDAWKLMKDPGEWAYYEKEKERIQFKFCGGCKPWKVFMEHIDNFPRLAATELKLTDFTSDWKR